MSAGVDLKVADHPRAARGVARARELGGLAGFLLGGYLSLPTHTLLACGVRALEAGVVCYVAVWGAAVFVWRRLVVAELRSRQQALIDAHRAQIESAPRSAGAPGSGR